MVWLHLPDVRLPFVKAVVTGDTAALGQAVIIKDKAVPHFQGTATRQVTRKATRQVTRKATLVSQGELLPQCSTRNTEPISANEPDPSE